MSYRLAFIIFLFLIQGCMSVPQDIGHAELAENFFQTHISMNEQEKFFQTYSIEEQYDIFLYGNQVIHPPAMFLADELAKQGPTIVPFLKRKLENTNNELTIRDIALVFAKMTRLKLYDFSADQELISLLTTRVSNMKGPWKKTAQGFVDEIRTETAL